MFKKIALTVALGMVGMQSAMAWNVESDDVAFVNEDNIEIPGKLFLPAGNTSASLPAVVLMHGCSGIYSRNPSTHEVIVPLKVADIYREWADRLTAQGYVVLLVDSFTPRIGNGYECGNGGGVGVSELFDRPQDARAAYTYLAGRNDLVDDTKIGLMGWSHGASSTMATLETTLATDGVTPNPGVAGQPFKVGVAFYPGCGFKYFDDSGQTKYGWTSITNSKWDTYAPLLINHGSADPLYYNGYNCTKRVNRASSLPGGSSVAMTVYPDALHSFDDPSVGACDKVTPGNTPNACAKQAADAASINMLNQYLNP